MNVVAKEAYFYLQFLNSGKCQSKALHKYKSKNNFKYTLFYLFMFSMFIIKITANFIIEINVVRNNLRYNNLYNRTCMSNMEILPI